MRKTTYLNGFVAVVFLSATIVGCEKSSREQVQPSQKSPTLGSEAKVARLVERAYQQSTQDEYDAITADYKALSFDELELFNKLKMETDGKKIEQKIAKAGARISQQQLALVANELKQVSTFRSGINKQSVALYGVPYNQLSDSLVNKLLDQEALNYSLAMPNLESLFDSDPNARVSQPNDCTSASFLLKAKKVSNGNVGWSGWTQRRTPGTTDCDYEFRYSGYRFDFDPKDWFADRLCDSFNNVIARRYASEHTRLLFGNRGVWFWIGYPGLTSVNMR